MKVLLINNGYPSTINPQYSTYIKSIEQCLHDANMMVELLVLETNFKGKVFKFFYYVRFLGELMMFKYRKYDVIYINNYPYCFFPLMLRIRKFKNVIIHWHGTDIIPPNWRKNFLNKISYKFLPQKHIAIVPSNFFVEKVREKLGIQRFKNIFISPSGGVDTKKFSKLKNEKCNIITLGFGSSLTSEKGADLILLLARRIKNLERICNKKIYLKVIAYGAEKKRFVNQLKVLKNVVIEFPIPKEQMVNFYWSIDLFLFPTKRKAESLGLVGLEAMACGKPVVGTNAFALKEYIIPGVTGELFELDNYQDFEKAIIRAIKNLGNYKPRELVVKKYSKDAVVQQYKQIFSAINE
ncbi:glycosyltransferase family 4 protein [Thermophagus sp. OGC60D27]|uniref:glycosyltransferase family 4 protein n=1 Tax=Thermophagus sp. OGC60D27 TaxID=3458415 RepID=UPI004037E169